MDFKFNELFWHSQHFVSQVPPNSCTFHTTKLQRSCETHPLNISIDFCFYYSITIPIPAMVFLLQRSLCHVVPRMVQQKFLQLLTD